MPDQDVHLFEEMLDNLQRVLKPRALSRWLTTPVPALDGRAPWTAIGEGDIEQVVAVTKSYLDTSFS